MCEGLVFLAVFGIYWGEKHLIHIFKVCPCPFEISKVVPSGASLTSQGTASCGSLESMSLVARRLGWWSGGGVMQDLFALYEKYSVFSIRLKAS